MCQDKTSSLLKHPAQERQSKIECFVEERHFKYMLTIKENMKGFQMTGGRIDWRLENYMEMAREWVNIDR